MKDLDVVGNIIRNLNMLVLKDIIIVFDGGYSIVWIYVINLGIFEFWVYVNKLI